MSRSKTREPGVERLPSRSLRFDCSCGGSEARTLKIIRVVLANLDRPCPRYRAWVKRDKPVTSIRRGRYDLIEYGGGTLLHSGREHDRADLRLVVDVPLAPGLYHRGWSQETDDADRQLRDGFEHVTAVTADGFPYTYSKLRLTCPRCPLDVTLAPESTDDFVREKVRADAPSVELTEVIRYSQR